MKVLLVIGTAAGGVLGHVRDVANICLTAGHQVVVAGPAQTIEGFAERVTLEEVAIGARSDPRRDLATIGRLRRLVADADLVHAHGLRAGALCALAMAGPGLRRRPLVVTLHNLPVGDAGVTRIGRVLLTMAARRADLVLGVSGDLVEAARGAGARQVARALVPIPRPDPPDLSAVLAARTSLGLSPDDALLVTVARLAPQKGLDTLITAVAGLAVALDRSAVSVVAGDGPLQENLTQQIAETGAPVRLLGRREDVAALLAAADLVVQPSLWEGQPLAVQEALLAGAAVIATDAGGTREVTDDAAVLVPPGDPAALTAALTQTLSTLGRVDELRARARQRATELPTLEDLRGQLIPRYSTLVRGSLR